MSTEKPRYLVALDPGTTFLGAAVFCDKRLSLTQTFESKHPRRHQRQKEIIQQVKKWIFERTLIKEPFEIACEEPMLLGKGNNAMQRMLGGLEEAFDRPFFYIHPMTVKRLMGGGRSSKEEVLFRCTQLLKEDPRALKMLDQIQKKAAFDESDAVAVALSYLILNGEIKPDATETGKEEL